MNNPLSTFNKSYDDFINVIAGKLDAVDEVLLRTIKINILEIFMICLIIFFTVRAL